MPSLSLYLPFGRSRVVLLRIVAILAKRPHRKRPLPIGKVDMPDYLRKDVGLPPEVERPPPRQHLFPF